VVDLAIGRQFHPLARIAKDCAAAAGLVAALSCLMIALRRLVPPQCATSGPIGCSTLAPTQRWTRPKASRSWLKR